MPHNILTKRSGCPNCSHSATSFIEQFLFLSLQEIFGIGSVLTRDKKTIGKELDIYIPCLKVAIEPGAWYYHKNSIKKDDTKKRFSAIRVEMTVQGGLRCLIKKHYVKKFSKYIGGK